ncbi:hypothetical protein [Terriglobus sp. ADX1]|uniref:hypothetical protein n=1 Tax=Terriglobus sp. ADX1 TaxID=2794063 RepID=UPI002FE60947
MRYLVSVLLVWVLGVGGITWGQDANGQDLACGDMPQKATLTKSDPASIEGAITAIAMLRQCQIVNRPGHRGTDDEKRCISKTLGSGAYLALAHIDLSTNPFYSNVGVRELVKCVNTPTNTDVNGGAAQSQVTLEAIQNHLADFLAERQDSSKLHEHPLPDVQTSRYRIIGGLSVAAAASQTPEGKFWGDAAVHFPLSRYQDLGAIFALWGDLRIASIAQPGPISSIATNGVSSYVTPASAAPSDIVQSFELHAGLDGALYTFGKNRTPNTISLVAAGGIITPISTSQWTPAFYQLSDNLISDLKGTYSEASSQFDSACKHDSNGKLIPCYVAFPPQDRTTLYRDWGTGVRMKWFWYDKTANTYTFPSNVDLLFGQSEYVTGGKLSGWVLHFGGTTPIPAYPWLFVTGSFDTRLEKANPGNSFTLVSAPSGTTLTLTDNNVVAIPVSQPNRDRWQFGIGFDLPTIMKHWPKKTQ